MKKKTHKVYEFEKELKVQAALGTMKVAKLLWVTDDTKRSFPELENYIGYFAEVVIDCLGTAVIKFHDGYTVLIERYTLEFL